MKNTIYFTYRRIWDNRTNCYDISYYNDKIFSDYKEAGLTEIIDWDNFIPSTRITKEIAPWVKWERKAWILKYVDWVDVVDLKETLIQTWASFWIEIKTQEEMLNWIRNNTDLEEVEEWKFKINDTYTDEMWDEVIEKYLII